MANSHWHDSLCYFSDVCSLFQSNRRNIATTEISVLFTEFQCWWRLALTILPLCVFIQMVPKKAIHLNFQAWNFDLSKRTVDYIIVRLESVRVGGKRIQFGPRELYSLYCIQYDNTVPIRHSIKIDKIRLAKCYSVSWVDPHAQYSTHCHFRYYWHQR